jgi:hypothetical protein
VIDEPTEIGVTMLLCDSAQSIGGKLYILGGGWTRATLPPDQPLPMALAILLSVPWDMANQRFKVRVYLTTHEGDPVDLGGGPVEAATEIELGRPAGLERGTPLDATFAITAGALPLEPGTYVWMLDIDGTPRARTLFQLHTQG